jgi:hypothetical protein
MIFSKICFYPGERQAFSMDRGLFSIVGQISVGIKWGIYFKILVIQ